MSFKNYSHDEIAEMSMLEIAHEILLDEKQALDFQDLFNKISEIKGLSKEEKTDRIAQFYTDLNTDGRFLTIGSNMWGLKRWYPVEQAEEEIQAPVKKKKKAAPKKKKAAAAPVEEEEDIEEEEIEDDLDLDDEELDLDEDGEENSGLDEDFDLAEDEDTDPSYDDDEEKNVYDGDDEEDDDEEEEEEENKDL
ncbi:DNA-directed RNA polymerase subunit delta [Pontibacillus sp. ALD_SL1]|uniref:DNA-directed RNA polymerase subunit delta n=1 Tax=Pontibacillus sp. ALD_SL1 TaxID=2777185 RepID=UPI001A962D39|nr:DNA-directed RNA polymerase subunit delta [Pontibacillus sp. ALD_SL1]QSS99866.1 DNA-directed RNA polymerase subunit delta [Pontibacillus sp. ALD_SL1]